MANHKRRRPKKLRNGCLYCKPWKEAACKTKLRRVADRRAEVSEREQREL